MFSPIEITFYNKENEVLRTYSRAVVPWGILKKAVRLMNEFDEKKPSPTRLFFRKDNLSKEERQMQAISQFVVELFGNQFTVRELEDGADVGEVMAAFQSILTRAKAIMLANPTPRPSSRKRA